MKQRAFTLIELLVVIAIVGILSSVIYTNITGLRDRARITAGIRFDSSLYHSIGDQLVGKYDLEEGTGGSGTVIKDASGLGNNGTINTAGTSWSTDTYNQTQSRYSISFSGADYFTPSRGFGISNSNFTFTEWIKTTSTNGQMYTIANAGGGDGYRFGLADGKIAFLIGNSGGLNESFGAGCTSRSVNDGSWHHIAGVFDRVNGIFSCYVDGNKVGTRSITYFANMNDSAPRIGKGICCTNFVGSLDDVRIYSSSLDGLSIRSIYEEEKNKYLVSN
ncbi:MAG: LamG-like jellyroll fold domain-containing protein [Candidatus Paceibacterota bacterium]|jgi:prepilin-type N-terminal cleavage/methylation domain-containing protein